MDRIVAVRDQANHSGGARGIYLVSADRSSVESADLVIAHGVNVDEPLELKVGMMMDEKNQQSGTSASGQSAGSESFLQREWNHFQANALPAIPGLTTRWVLRAGIPAALFYSAVVFGLGMIGASIIEVITDPEIPEGQKWFRGVLSNIGIVLWIATGSICLFSAWCTKVRPESLVLRRLLIAGGVLSLMLAADDGLMLHDRIKHQLRFYAVYAGVAGYIVLRFFRELQSLDFVALVLSGGCLAMSIFVDLIQMDIPVPYQYSQFFEEGFKFVGIVGWSYFWMRTSRDVSSAA